MLIELENGGGRVNSPPSLADGGGKRQVEFHRLKRYEAEPRHKVAVGRVSVTQRALPLVRPIGVHAAALSGAREGVQGSMRSSVEMSASDKPVSTSCRQPVARKIWIASGRDGRRFAPKISLA